MPGPAAAALASEGGDIAKAAGESDGLNIAFVIAALAVAYGVYRWTNTVSDVADTGTDVVRDVSDTGTDVVEQGADTYFGIVEDTHEGVSGAAGDVWVGVGDAGDYVVDGAENTIGGLV